MNTGKAGTTGKSSGIGRRFLLKASGVPAVAALVPETAW
jgi:hypothetical protein